MPFDRREFTPDFVRHLAALGIGAVPAGTFWVDHDTLLEPPMRLSGVTIWQAPAIVGAFTYFGATGNFQNAAIGRYCSVAEGVGIGRSRHPADWLTSSPVAFIEFHHFQSYFADRTPGWQRALPEADFEVRPPTYIGNDVWIGANAYIKDGVTIGDGAIIGAHAVVTRDVPPYAIVGGSPARVIRMRFPEKEVERLLAIGWWQYNLLEIGGLDVTDIERSLDRLEELTATGALVPYDPEPIHLAGEHARFAQRRATPSVLVASA